MRYSTKLFLYFVLVTVASTAVALSIVFFGGRILLFNQIRSQMLSIAITSSSFLNGDTIKTWHSIEETRSQDYKIFIHDLRELRNLQRRSDVFIKYLYVIKKDATGNYIFIADAEEDPAFVSYYGDPCAVSAGFLKRSSDTPYVSPKPYTDAWGRWFTTYVPIYDSQLNVVAWLCMDVSTQQVYQELDKLITYSITALIGTLLIALITAYILARIVTRSLGVIYKGVHSIREGDLTTRLSLNTKDEFQQLAIAINEMAKSLQDKERLTISFGRYVSHHILETILSSNQPTHLEGERKKVTVLFCDIHQFTSIAEMLSAETVVSLLNEYLEKMIHIIFDHQGTLDKFIGDGIMAEFGVPLEDPEQEAHAVQSALGMHAMSKSLSNRWKKDYQCEIKVGIGIHTGLAIVGNIGSQIRMEYTAIGDTVNVASRLEKATKELHVSIIISEETHEALKESNNFYFKDLGELKLHGREHPIRAYAVTPSQQGESL